MDFNNFTSFSGDGMSFYNQKPPMPPPMAKTATPFNYGWPITPGMPPLSQLSNQWIHPAQSVPMPPNGRSFPRKGRPGFGFQGGRGKRPFQTTKPFDPTGKTPAMLLHELFKEITERYEEQNCPQGKKYICRLTINGTDFAMEGSSKKIAKQKAAEHVIRQLRPDIPITPIEEWNPPTNQRQSSSVQKGDQIATQSYVPDVLAPPTPPPLLLHPPPLIPVQKKTGPPVKKAKIQIPAIDSALSLVDALRKLCLERTTNGPYNPSFEFEELNDPLNQDKFKKKYLCILSFPEKNMKFTAEGVGRSAPKDMVCLKALKEEFGVTEKQIRAIMRRNVLGKGGNMPIVQTFHHVINLCHCTAAFKTEAVEPDIGVGIGKQLGFTCELTLTDHTQDDKIVVITGGPMPSKHEAKEAACYKMLKEHFEIDPENMAQQIQPVPPCQQLQVLCAKRFKKNDSLVFEDLGTVGVKDHASFGFKYKCTVEGREFYGTGVSKKEAKNAAAIEALHVLNGENIEQRTSPECYEITEYTKRNHVQLCQHFGISLVPSHFAAFILINERNEKRIASLSAMPPRPVNGEQVANSEGQLLHHLDPIVMARRGFVKYLMTEIENYHSDVENNIFVKRSDGMFQLKDDIRLAICSTFCPTVQNSKEFADKRGLVMFGKDGPELSVEASQTIEEIRSTKNLKCHSPADKIFKWTHLGVQGALLSTILHPILIDRIYFACQHDFFTDNDIHHSFYSRLGPPTRDVKAEFAKAKLTNNRAPASFVYRYYHVIEHLGPDGRTATGDISSFSRAALYEDYLRINPNIHKDMTYGKAKSLATLYNQSKKMLFDQLEAKEYGKWHRKPIELSEFTISPSEVNMETPSNGFIDFTADA